MWENGSIGIISVGSIVRIAKSKRRISHLVSSLNDMSNKFVKKNIKLSVEFDRYLSRNEHLYKQIPRGAHIIITDRKDKRFSESTRNLAQRSAKGGRFIEARKEGKEWKLEPLPSKR